MRHDVEDDDMIEDGGSVRVPMTMMDARLTDAVSARRKAQNVRARWVRSLTDSWKMPPGQPVSDARRKRDDDDDDDAADGRRRPLRGAADARAISNTAYRRMVAGLQDAWRTPSRDAALPHEDPAAAMRAHLGGGDDDDDENDNGNGNGNNDNPQARRDSAWNSYKASLGNAWRGPQGIAQPQPTKAGAGPSGFIAAAESPDPAARARAIEREGEKWRQGA